MAGRDAAWVGWAGEPGPAPEPFREKGCICTRWVCPRPRSRSTTRFQHDTLWPIFHDVIVPASFHRNWWNTYRRVNDRFATAIVEWRRRAPRSGCTTTSSSSFPRWSGRCDLMCASGGSTTSRSRRSSSSRSFRGAGPCWRVCWGGLPGLSAHRDAENFLRACRRLLGMSTKADTVTFTPPGDDPSARRTVRAAAIPISVDFKGLDELSRTPEVITRAAEIRASLGDPRILMWASTGWTTPRESGTA